eukprot:6470399-Amphidinium_carterae.1
MMCLNLAMGGHLLPCQRLYALGRIRVRVQPRECQRYGEHAPPRTQDTNIASRASSTSSPLAALAK